MRAAIGRGRAAVAVLVSSGAFLGAPPPADVAPAPFYTVVPCRVFDSRQPGQGPALGSGVERTVAVAGTCGIPAEAAAVAFNVVVTEETASGNLRMHAAGGPVGLPVINFPAWTTRANNGVARLSAAGEIALLPHLAAPGTLHVVIDVSGYFVDDVPPTAVDDTATVDEDSAATAVDVLANDTDPDGGAISVASVTPPAHGAAAIAGGGTQVTYAPAADYCNTPPGTALDTFTYTLGPGTSSATVTVTVACVNDAPALAGAGTATFTEGGSPVAVAPALTASDVDDTTLESATVTITNLLDPGLETLAATTAGTSITALFVAPTLTLSGTDTLASYEAVLRSVTYHDASPSPDATPRVVAFAASDGALTSAPQAATVTITAVNDAPVVTAGGGSPTFVEGGAAVAVDPALTVADSDDTSLVSATVTITNLLDPGAETLAASTAGTAIVAAYAPPTLTLAGTDTLASYQSVLRSVSYANSSEDPATTPRALAFVANDGEAASAAATTTVGVTAVNDAPVLVAGGGSPSFTEDGPAVAVDPLLAVADADDATLASATVTITNLLDGGAETLSAITGGTAITAVYAAPTLTLSGTDSLAAYQAVLRSVAYANASQDPATAPRSIQLVANDGSDAGNTVTAFVSVVAANDPPILGGAGAVTFTEGDGPVAVAPALVVSDVDDAALLSATVTITNLSDAGAELLLADTTGTSILAAYVAPTLTLTGPDTLAAWQAVLRSVAYRNTSESPSPTTRTVAFVASDGTATGGAVATVAVVSVNDPPALGTNPVAYATAGNTQLHVAGDTLPGVAAVADAQGVLAKAGVVDVDGPAPPAVVAASGTTANGGQFAVDADGSFTYVPAAGFAGTDSFPYVVTDTVDTATGTVDVTVGTVVWYVRDVVDGQNPAGGDGRSTDAFETLAAAQAASGENHVLFVFEGDTATTPHSGAVVLKNGQKLLGEGVGLSVPPFGTLVPAGSRPHLVNAGGDAVSVSATAGPRTSVEVRGLDIVASGNAVAVTASGANSVSVTIAANTMQAGHHAIELRAGATGGGATFTAVVQTNSIATGANGLDARTGAGSALRLDFSGNSVAANGSGVVVDGLAGGSLVVTGFGGNTVSPATVGDGILVRSAVFDAVPGGIVDPVAAGATTIGTSGNGVGGSGLLLLNVAGAVDFADLDVFADGGAALLVTGTGAFTGAGGTQVAVADGVATLEATGGPAVDATAATLRLVAARLATTDSATTGVSLVNVSDGPAVEARLSAPAASFITRAAGTAFNVSGGNAGVSFAGPITNTAGRSVSITGWAGDDGTDDLELAGAIDDGGTGIVVTSNGGPRTITFGGTLTLHPVPGSAGFTATSNANAGGLRVTGAGNTVTTTNAAALTVTNTTIGAGGLAFQALSASGGTNGIVLASTGTLGGLAVAGTGAAGSGGTVQNMTGDGVRLTSTRDVSLAHMVVHNNDGSGVYGDDVTNFTIGDSTVTDNADTATGTEAGLRFQELLGDCAITNTVVSGSFEDDVRITPASGALVLTVSGTTIGPSSPTTGGNGVALVGGGSASASVTVTGSTFQGHRGAGFLSNYAGTGGHTVVVSGNVFRDNGRAVSLAANGAAGLNLGVTNNVEIVRSAGNAVELMSSADTAAATRVVGTVSGNVVGDASANSGSRDAYGIVVDQRGDERTVVAVTGNDVRHTDLSGLFVTDADFAAIPGPPSDSDVTVRDNTVRDVDDDSGFPCGSPWGTLVDLRHDTLGCLDLFSNASAESPAACPDTARFRVRQRNTSTVLFERLSDGDATPSELIVDPAVVQAHVVNENDPGTTANVLLATGFTEAASGACVKP